MKRFIAMLLLLSLLTGSAFAQADFAQITPEAAKQLMDAHPECAILDARTQEEYDEGHIEGAVCIPDTEVADKAPALLPDKDQMILVYCRSGRRSKNAAAALVGLGYTDVREFGGIIDWPYETVKTVKEDTTVEIKITKDNFQTEVMESNIPVLLDFWATWCGPCRMIAPIIEEIANEYAGKIKVGKVNVDEEPELSNAFRVMSIPMLAVVKEGKITNTGVGYMPKERVLELLK